MGLFIEVGDLRGIGFSNNSNNQPTKKASHCKEVIRVDAGDKGVSKKADFLGIYFLCIFLPEFS